VEFCLLLCGVPLLELLSLGVAGSRLSWARSVIIHSCWSSSTALARLFGSRSKHFLRKSIPVSLSCSLDGSCGGSPWAMWYMMAHSLSMEAQGRRPVAISRITQPSDHISTAPCRPVLPPRMTSGDMYIGVPVIERWRPWRVALCSAARVRPWRAMSLAAPKSTNLMTPLWSSRMSGFD